ncbi:MAG: TIGR03668 family PPOX class F420-dependent oxidoreductase [Acidothermus sp.]|nr:TIGR03668 family PPOX class F420-dependent oxidoreductase [Acidothermus sp.]MCL6537549.1 TIGR03668 family PPOX class F420-dependent oxidoreductase [Acidothermus sp.]
MDGETARRLFASAQVARLATCGADGVPHIVPIVFALVDDTIYTAVDTKPKSGRPLKRIRNISENPHVAVLADVYSDDWPTLWWVRADGRARVLDPGDDEAAAARDRLIVRYPQYATSPPPGPVVAIDVLRWIGWSASPSPEVRPAGGRSSGKADGIGGRRGDVDGEGRRE